MAADDPAAALSPPPSRGRTFGATRTVRLGDVDVRGSMRLDAVARHLQDVAADDADDAGLDPAFAWVVRRTRIEVVRAPALGSSLELRTWCSGTGRAWAERRTSITSGGVPAIEAVSLWVQIDAASGRPAALDATFHDRYGEAAGARRVSSRLALPPPPSGAARPWEVRAVDLDALGHVNNAVHWAIVEEALGGAVRRGVGEVEHLAAIDRTTPAELLVAPLGGGTGVWLVADGRVHTAARWGWR